ncbi:EAL domain-containing protein [Methylomonas koyamae]|uniref:EAL domain-containing protein n=1 Tax=Methylomonas koyamae TaxID=702114 RepID=UPI001C328E67|nr:EAL domain-containing protein [Methylomonas koyamae]BBL59037.1 hypothetical protein MKFW12EY_26500 [Methylomonas koyamae]
MKPIVTLRLSRALPALVIGSFGLLLLFSLFYQHNRMLLGIETEAMEDVRRLLADTELHIETLYRHGQQELIAEQIAELAVDSHIDSAALLDASGKVLRATRFEWIGRNYAELSTEPGPAEFERLRAERRAAVRFSADRQRLTAYQAVAMATDPGRLRPNQIGLLVLNYDLSRSKAASWNLLVRSMYPIWGIGILLLIAMASAISLWMERPLRHLVDVVGRFAGGDYRVRSRLAGNSELAILGDALNRMAAELATTIAELAESKENLAVTLFSIGDGVIATDAQGRVSFMNDVAQTLTGWHLADAAGLPLERVFHIVNAYSRQPTEAPVAKVLATGCIMGLANHTVLIAKGGAEYQIADSAAPIRRQDGEICGVVLVFRDVTEEYALRESLQQEQALLRSLVDAVPDLIFFKDRDSVYLGCNKAFARYAGKAEAELLGKTDFDCFDNETAAGFRQHDIQILQTGRSIGHEEWITYPDGERVLLDTVKTPFFGADGQASGVVGISRDVTERKRFEQRLADSEARYRALSELLPQMVWTATADGALDYTNDWVIEYFGCGAEQLAGAGWQKYVHPEDLPAVSACWRQAVESGSVYEAELRLRHHSGRYFYHLARAVPHRDSQGAIAKWYGCSTDISERKKAEERLELSARVFQEAHEAIMITGVDGNIVDVNPAFSTMTGYSRAEAVGQNPRMLGSGRHPPEFFAEMWQSVREQGYWRGEIWNRKKNGELHAGLLSISTLPGSNGDIRHYIGLFSDITEKKLSEEQIWRQANFDALTGLPNRRMFLDRLAREIRKAHRNGSVLALLFLDLDRFKEINDILGHIQGDSLLQIAAERLAGCVRDTDTVSRLGGDEFTIILPDLENGESAERVAQNILRKMAEPFPLNGELNYVTASIGITLYPNDSLDQEQLIKNADQAMYAAKERGRNGYSFFTASMQQTAQFRLAMVTDLRSALANCQLEVYYQPIVELPDGAISKAEALLRWRHPQRGMVSPAQFIPLAEESGLIHEIGDWVFRQAAQQAKLLRERYRADFQISVNKSPVQFRPRSDADFGWLNYLKSLELDGAAVVVEITEGLLLDAQTLTKARLLDFRDAGVQVAIDDFGTGYSSLSYIKKFDIDYIKIDRSFINNLSPESQDEALCEAIIVMAHKLGLKVVAEGVETAQQRDWLIAAGCDYAQGYLFNEPMAGPQLLELLAGSRLA